VAVTRRNLIRRVLLIVGMAPAWLIGCASRWVAGPSESNEPAPDSPSGSRRLSSVEVADLVAFGEVLVEGRTLAPAGRRYLVEHVEERSARSPEYLALYRTAVSILDRVAGRRFATLEVPERIDLVTRHRLAATQARGETLSEEMRALRTRVVPDLIRGYYGSPAGWAAVGYDQFPGRCGDLARYTHPEA
jgi:hypothetical protein